jgi:hypothetical protein
MSAHRVFLLSPASTGGKRASLLFNERASFPLATRLRDPSGASLGDVFSFLSGLYFRGKLAYASRFSRAPATADGALVITSSRGLLSPQMAVSLDDLREFAAVPIDAGNPVYTTPLIADATRLATMLGRDADVVLLGSIASDKYVGVFGEIFGERLLFPGDFVGRGDMSRGGLMLRCVQEERELEYIPVAGAVRRGARPAKLAPVRARRSRPDPAR